MTSALRRAWLPVLVVALGAALLTSFVRWSCPIARVTGHPCPACGLTRAAQLASKGLFLDATRMHPLVWVVVPLVAVVIGLEVAGYVRTGAFGASRRVRGLSALSLAAAIALFLLWIARFFGALGGPVAV